MFLGEKQSCHAAVAQREKVKPSEGFYPNEAVFAVLARKVDKCKLMACYKAHKQCNEFTCLVQVGFVLLAIWQLWFQVKQTNETAWKGVRCQIEVKASSSGTL